MAVFRVEKNRNYTTMSNYHLRDRNLSLKAKGLLSMCLSLTDTWDYSINGLTAISKEGRDAVLTAVRELEQAGYIVRTRTRDDQGRLRGAEYTIYEVPRRPDAPEPALDSPMQEKPTQENPSLGRPVQENPAQSSNNQSNTEEINHREKKAVCHRYGAYQNVLLSDEELGRLQSEFPYDYAQRIERLSEYMASTGKSYKSHLATLRSWARREQPVQKPYNQDRYQFKEGESL